MPNELLFMLAKADPILGKVIDTIPEPIIQSTQDVFFDLMSCVIEQQIHYRSTKKIFQKILQKADLETLTIANFDKFEAKGLSNIKLSSQKHETIWDVVEFFNQNHIQWTNLKDAEVVENLSRIKGIGKWTIDMILLFTLERPDIFPADDFHLKKIMTNLYGLNPKSRLKAQMLEISKLWGTQKSLSVRYLWDYKKTK